MMSDEESKKRNRFIEYVSEMQTADKVGFAGLLVALVF